MLKRLLLLFMLNCIIISSLFSCSVFKTDRAYLSPQRFLQAKNLYDQAGVWSLTERTLRYHGWTTAEINEAKYRLEKINHLEDPYEPVLKTD